MAKRIGVVLVAPTLAKEKQNRAQQIGQRIRDLVGVARIKQVVDQPLDDPGALHDLAQHDRTRLGGQTIRSRLDAKGLVERGTEER